MKYTIPILALAAGLANASPLRILMVSNVPPVAMTNTFRIGHIAANNDLAHAIAKSNSPGAKRPCHGNHAASRTKSIDLSNAFRQALGWPLIEESHLEHPALVAVSSAVKEPLTTVHVDHPHRFMRNKWQATTFLKRAQKSLLALGTWEARAVAFIIGCGMGALVRMLFTLALLGFRSVASRKDAVNDDESRSEMLFDEETEAAPKYTDEKAPVHVVEKN